MEIKSRAGYRAPGWVEDRDKMLTTVKERKFIRTRQELGLF